MEKKTQSGSKQYHNLVIDYGNTLVKAAIFDKDELIEVITKPDLSISDIDFLLSGHFVKHVILSTVRDVPDEISDFLKTNFHFLELTHETPLPIKNLYKTPETLGRDRLALVVAGFYLFHESNVLAIDAGTCITFDFLDHKGNYHGGGISPGIQMRFKALNTFTARLPLVTIRKIGYLSGATTEESILSGVLNGVIAEIDGIISNYNEAFPSLIVVISGGDADYFAEKLKSNIFAIQNLVLKGLNKILQFNVEKEPKSN